MSQHVCETCGRQGDVTFSGAGERHAHLATCSREDCPQTLAARRFAQLILAMPKILPDTRTDHDMTGT